jgi:uncharacterized protein YjbI with pentapeptide repeats
MSDLQRRQLTLSGAFQFLGASSIVAIITWCLTSFVNHKNNQQSQLNNFINTISTLMIDKGLDQPGSESMRPPVSRAARGFALNTLENLDGVWPIGDPEKKEELLKFLYDSRMIGHCNIPSVGSSNLKLTSQSLQDNICTSPRIDLKDAKLNGLRFLAVGSVLKGIHLPRAKIQDSNLSTIDLRKSNFSTSDLSDSDLSYSLLDSSNFERASLVQANLTGASLGNALFEGAQLCGANLTGATGLETANFKNASYDKKTMLTSEMKQKLTKDGAFLISECRKKTA